MSAAPSTGSPASRRTPACNLAPKEENLKVGKEDYPLFDANSLLKAQTRIDPNGPSSVKKSIAALSTSSLANQGYPQVKHNHESYSPANDYGPSPLDKLLAKLGQQPAVAQNKGEAAKIEEEVLHPTVFEHDPSSNSMPMTPATEGFGTAAPATRPASATMNAGNITDNEVLRLKLELAHAQSKISRLDQELSQTRPVSSSMESSVMNSPLDADFPTGASLDQNPNRIPGLQVQMPGRQQALEQDSGAIWSPYDDCRSDTSDALSATGYNRSREFWGGAKPAQNPFMPSGAPPPDQAHASPWSGRGSWQSYLNNPSPFGPPSHGSARIDRYTPDFDMTVRPPVRSRSSRFDNRFGADGYGGQPSYSGGHNYGSGQYESNHGVNGGSQGPVGPGPYSHYQPSPMGASLSPLASEFTSGNEVPWKTEPGTSEGQTYLPTTEPLNYRRLLDRNATCNWKYIVDKIVCNNDQQASIFLQQKLKVGTPEQKYEIVEAIVAQAYPLMVNRFGNFLVQRCFEHGTPEQVIKIAEAIRGCTLNLSMDPFGCHVVQKAFDSVPENYKAVMVDELLRRIPDTVIHRYACHVWQKLFELRWTTTPPQIMKYVNDSLRGMWHEVALGETGSLVVQNIFENCLEDDKRPCIEEVLQNIDIVAHGQFGNWCIQHICEHGAPKDRSRAVDHVTRYAAEYSMDQYASKVVEKCLKIGGPDFLGRYLDRVCEGRMNRPRIPLIDIASDQYGNYLIQWILTNASPQHREIVAAHIRKHMVSLRGSKFGSRVGMLCTNPAVATRPGPGMGNGFGRIPAGPRYGSRAYQ